MKAQKIRGSFSELFFTGIYYSYRQVLLSTGEDLGHLLKLAVNVCAQRCMHNYDVPTAVFVFPILRKHNTNFVLALSTAIAAPLCSCTGVPMADERI